MPYLEENKNEPKTRWSISSLSFAMGGLSRLPFDVNTECHKHLFTHLMQLKNGE